jgi:Bacterial Ig-like domain (group 3)
VTLTATIGGVVGNTIGGTVTFYDGTTVLGTSSVNSPSASSPASATLTIGLFALGAHTITASYSGDGNFLGSNSNPITQTVNQALDGSEQPATISLSYQGPVSVSYGSTATLTASITGAYASPFRWPRVRSPRY